MEPINVMLVNESSESEVDAWNTAWALDYQARWQFGPMWRIYARVTYIPKARPVPVGSWVIHLVDQIDTAGALGYHDEDGNLVPYARVGVQTAIQGGTSASEVASHELLELLVDPHVDLASVDTKNSRLYAYEVGDPAQGNTYDVGAPYGRTTGVAVADFALPGWFDNNTPADAPTSYRGACKGPFGVAPQGYTSWVDLNNYSKGWQQSWGAERTVAPPPDGDHRLQQRGVIVPAAS